MKAQSSRAMINILSRQPKGRIPHERGTTFPRNPPSKGNNSCHSHTKLK